MNKGGAHFFQKKVELYDPKAKKSDLLKLGLGAFGVPLICPNNSSSTFCFKSEKIVTFTESTMKLLQIFPVIGNTASVKVIITHNNGQSCFETENVLIEEKIVK